ncbi:hypothetical protein HA069_23420 [Escherichia coli]|nr:hypothetical protein [Escherichia coli]
MTKDVEPYAIVGGSPAQLVKYRFPPEIIQQLLALHIYDWAPEKFQALRPFLTQNNIEALIEAEKHYSL